MNETQALNLSITYQPSIADLTQAHVFRLKFVLIIKKNVFVQLKFMFVLFFKKKKEKKKSKSACLARKQKFLVRRGKVVSASGSETSVSSSTPASAIIYDAYTSSSTPTSVINYDACTSIIKKRGGQRVRLGNERYEFDAYQRHYL